jgi:hypothetical protein
MESVLSNYEEGKNFWKLYPSYKAPKLYKQLHTNDKSKGKSASSKLMWALHFLFDKSEDNPYKGLDRSDRFDVVTEDIIGDSEFDWDKYKDEIAFSENIMLTEVEKTYYAYVEFMEKRRSLMEEEQDKMTLESLQSLDNAIKRNKENLAELTRLKGIVENQSEEGRTKGDIIESARERKLF